MQPGGGPDDRRVPGIDGAGGEHALAPNPAATRTPRRGCRGAAGCPAGSPVRPRPGTDSGRRASPTSSTGAPASRTTSSTGTGSTSSVTSGATAASTRSAARRVGRDHPVQPRAEPHRVLDRVHPAQHDRLGHPRSVVTAAGRWPPCRSPGRTGTAPVRTGRGTSGARARPPSGPSSLRRPRVSRSRRSGERRRLGGAAAQQGVREGDVGAGGDVQLDDVEARARGLPLEERRPGLAGRRRDRGPRPAAGARRT